MFFRCSKKLSVEWDNHDNFSESKWKCIIILSFIISTYYPFLGGWESCCWAQTLSILHIFQHKNLIVSDTMWTFLPAYSITLRVLAMKNKCTELHRKTRNTCVEQIPIFLASEKWLMLL